MRYEYELGKGSGSVGWLDARLRLKVEPRTPVSARNQKASSMDTVLASRKAQAPVF